MNSGSGKNSPVISIEKALLSDRRMRALTSMDGEAFCKLEKRFADVLAGELLERTRAGQRRKRAAGGGRKGVLPSVRHKLFFILFYLKAYPTQDVMGYFFGLSQPQVCERVNQLLPLLKTLLAVELPARHGRDLAEVMAQLPEVKEVLVDGTERPIQRPKDPEEQEEDAKELSRQLLDRIMFQIAQNKEQFIRSGR